MRKEEPYLNGVEDRPDSAIRKSLQNAAKLNLIPVSQTNNYFINVTIQCYTIFNIHLSDCIYMCKAREYRMVVKSLLVLLKFQPQRKFPGETHLKNMHKDLRLYIMKELSVEKHSGTFHCY